MEILFTEFGEKKRIVWCLESFVCEGRHENSEQSVFDVLVDIGLLFVLARGLLIITLKMGTLY